MKKRNKAFTLAEMMVVMLILTVMLAAFAPLMTKRKAGSASESPWRYAVNNTDAYFGIGDNQTAMIGQRAKNAGENARLIINTKDNQQHILFKKNGTQVADLLFNNGNFLLGTSFSNLSGHWNTVFGSESLSKTTTGNFNTALGAYSLRDNVTGSANTALGYSALASNNTGSDNVAVGRQAMEHNTSGSNNIALGDYAAGGLQTGNYNVALGSGALFINTSGHNNVAIGKEVSYYLNGNNNVGIGLTSMGSTAESSGANNIGIGYESLPNGVNGDNNIALGSSTLIATNVSGSENIAIGKGSASANTSGNYNIAIGSSALSSNTTGNYNIAIGANALKSLAGSTAATSTPTGTCRVYKTGNTGATPCVNANRNKTYYNVTRNECATYRNNAESGAVSEGITYCAFVFDWSQTSSNTVGGESNIAIGRNACANVKGSNKTCIGANSGPSSGTTTNTDKIIYLGDADTLVYIPGHLVVDKTSIVAYNSGEQLYYRLGDLDSSWGVGRWYQASSNKMTHLITGNLEYEAAMGTSWTTIHSDKRLKNIKGENKSGLEKVRELKVFDFTFKNDDTKTPRVGVIAQDLKKIFPAAVTKDDNGFLKIRMEDMFYAVVNAVKQLDTFVQSLIQEIKNIRVQFNIHDSEIKKLKQENIELRERLEKLERKVL